MAQRKPTAVYIRVSTMHQDTAGQSERIKRWLDGHNIKSCDVKWYVDQGVSGATLKRPRFADLQEALFDGEHDTVVMYSLDRFARNMIDGMVELEKWKSKAKIIFVDDMLEFAGGNDLMTELFLKILSSVKLAFAEMEREKIRRRQEVGYSGVRVKQALARKLRGEGKSYTEIADRLSVNVERAKLMADCPANKFWWHKQRKATRSKHFKVKDAQIMRDAGLSYDQVARAMGCSKRTAYDLLNPERAIEYRKTGS